MSRLVFAVLAGLVATQFCAPARASTLDYTLTFTASSGSGDTGSFELNGPINTSGTHNYSLTELAFSVDGLSFNLAQDTHATVSFTNGLFSGLNFSGTDITGYFTFDTLTSSGTGYSIEQNDRWTIGAGSISAVDPPGAAPLPPTVVLFSAGLLLFGAFAWSRRRTAQIQSQALATA